MLLNVLESAGIPAVAINGSLNIHERARRPEEFRTTARVLVSTDAGGEGVNLQFAHVVINYDLPWRRTKIEQRIGRVDRIGQTAPVKAMNLAMEQSIDARVLDGARVEARSHPDELGTDKASDILNSADHHAEDLYLAAISGQELQDAAASFEASTKAEVADAATFLDLVETDTGRPTIGGGDDPQPWIKAASDARQRILGGHPTGNVLGALPEVSPAEPVPVIDGARPGLFAMWEVGRNAGDRTCRAVFLTVAGGVRPGLGGSRMGRPVCGTSRAKRRTVDRGRVATAVASR